MELYTLDSSLRRTAVIDRYESLIWTERYASAGDFELTVASTDEARTLLAPGTRLAINKSYRVMTVEEIEDKDDSEGRSLLTVKGPSLEDIMDDRTTQWLTSQLNRTTGAWQITGTATYAAREIFRVLLTSANTTNPDDAIPFYTAGSLYSADTIAEPDVSQTFTIDNASVLDVLQNLASIYGFGFRLYRGLDDSKIYFNVYTGSDRTTQQTLLPAVIFSQALDTLSEVSELRQTSDYKNVAYVFNPNGMVQVFAQGYESGAKGFDRKVINVDASDITLAAGSALNAALVTRGKEVLSQHKNFSAIDGKAPENGKYVYGVHYNLGDLVEMQTRDGTTQNMRITEQIFSEDAEGERSYPTLVADVFITPGSWLAWDAGQAWDQATGQWDDL